MSAPAPTEVASAPTSPAQATTPAAAPSADTTAAQTAPRKLDDDPDFIEWRSKVDRQRADLERRAQELAQTARQAQTQLEQQQLAAMDDEQRANYWQQKVIQQEQQQVAEYQRQQAIQHWNGQARELFSNAGIDPRDPKVRAFFADQFAAEPSAEAHSKLAARLVQYQAQQLQEARAEAAAERKRGATDALNEAGVTITSAGSGAGAVTDRTTQVNALRDTIKRAKAKSRHGGLSERDYARYMSQARALGLDSLPL